MAKVSIIECDRCQGRIRKGKKKSEHEAPLYLLTVAGGDKMMRRDMCSKCKSEFDLFMRNVQPEKPTAPGVNAELVEELRRAREIANNGIRAYADGASTHTLVASLRDVASAARRGA